MSIATRIAALEAAIEKGVRQVQDENGRTVQYHSLPHMMAALASLQAQDAAADTSGFKFSKVIAPGARG